MKWNISKSAFLIGIFLPELALASVEIFTLDPRHTNVQWHVNHFGFSNLSGKWIADGILILDKTHPEKSRLRVTVQIDNLITGIPELDTQLKSKLFFDTTTYPTATFNSLKIESTDDVTAKVDGMLTLHGVSKPITLYVILNKMGENPLSDSMTAGFSAVAEIKRSDFKINALLPELGDNVVLNIEAEAFKTGEAETTDIEMPEIEPTHLPGYGHIEEASAETTAVEPEPESLPVVTENKNDDPLAFSAAANREMAQVGLSTESGQKHVWSVDVSTLIPGDQPAITIAGETNMMPVYNAIPGILPTQFEQALNISPSLTITGPLMISSSTPTDIDADGFRQANAAYQPPAIQVTAGPQKPVITQAFLKLKTLMQRTVAAAKSYHPVYAAQNQSTLATTKQVPKKAPRQTTVSIVETPTATTLPPVAIVKESIPTPRINAEKITTTATEATIATEATDYVDLKIPNTLSIEIILGALQPASNINTADSSVKGIDAAAFRQAHAEYPAALHIEPQQTTLAAGIINSLNNPPQLESAVPTEPTKNEVPATVAHSEHDETALADTLHATAADLSIYGRKSLPYSEVSLFQTFSPDEMPFKALDAASFRQAHAAYSAAFHREPQRTIIATAGQALTIGPELSIPTNINEEEATTADLKNAPTPVDFASLHAHLTVFPTTHSLVTTDEMTAESIFGKINAAAFRQANASYPAAFLKKSEQTMLAQLAASVKKETAVPVSAATTEADFSFYHSELLSHSSISLFTKSSTTETTFKALDAVAFRQANAAYPAAFHQKPQPINAANSRAIQIEAQQTTLAAAPAMMIGPELCIPTDMNSDEAITSEKATAPVLTDLVSLETPLTLLPVTLLHSGTNTFAADSTLRKITAVAFRQANAEHSATFPTKLQTRLADLATSATKETATPAQPITTEADLSIFGRKHTAHDDISIFMKTNIENPPIKALDAAVFRQANAAYSPAFRTLAQPVNPGTTTMISALKKSIQSELAAELAEAKQSKKQTAGIISVEPIENCGLSIYSHKEMSFPGLNINIKYNPGKNTFRGIDAAGFREANAAFPAAFQRLMQQKTPSSVAVFTHPSAMLFHNREATHPAMLPDVVIPSDLPAFSATTKRVDPKPSEQKIPEIAAATTQESATVLTPDVVIPVADTRGQTAPQHRLPAEHKPSSVFNWMSRIRQRIIVASSTKEHRKEETNTQPMVATTEKQLKPLTGSRLEQVAIRQIRYNKTTFSHLKKPSSGIVAISATDLRVALTQRHPTVHPLPALSLKKKKTRIRLAIKHPSTAVVIKKTKPLRTAARRGKLPSGRWGHKESQLNGKKTV